MSKSSIDPNQLQRTKKTTPESKFAWLQSALEFARAKTQIVSTKKTRKKSN